MVLNLHSSGTNLHPDLTNMLCKLDSYNCLLTTDADVAQLNLTRKLSVQTAFYYSSKPKELRTHIHTHPQDQGELT
jgi:hypothetical protein